MSTGTAVSTGDIITAAKMNLKLESVDDDEVSKTDARTYGVDGTGQDCTWYTDTASVYMKLDVSEEHLIFTDDFYLKFGDASDVSVTWNGSALLWLPVTDDTGIFQIGNGTNDMDFTWYGGAATKYVTFDVGSSKVTLEDIDLYLGDNDQLIFGDGADIVIDWTGSLYLLVPATNDTGAINIGNGTTDIDLKIFLGSTNEYVEFNVGDSKTNFVGNASTVITVTSTLTGATADNAVEINVTDSQTNSSGYARGLYISATAGGTKTGSGEHNSLGIDLTVSGDTPYAYIGSLYMVTSDNPTISLASAMTIYIDDLGTATAHLHLLDLQYGSTNAPTTRNAYQRFRNHSDNTPTTIMYLQANNNAKAATYLIEQEANTKGPVQVGTLTNDTIGTDAEDGWIDILVGATAAKIPFWYDD